MWWVPLVWARVVKMCVPLGLSPPPSHPRPAEQIVLPSCHIRTVCEHLDLAPELPSCPHCLLRLDEPLQDLLLTQSRERLPSRPDSSAMPSAGAPAASGSADTMAAGAASGDGAAGLAWPNIWEGVACRVCSVMRKDARGSLPDDIVYVVSMLARLFVCIFF